MSRSRFQRRSKTWLYEGIPCELWDDVPAVCGSISVAADHPWHGLPPRQCTVRGGRVDCRGHRRCYGRGADWVFELLLPADQPGSIRDAEFEVELLADAAAFVAKGGAV